MASYYDAAAYHYDAAAKAPWLGFATGRPSACTLVTYEDETSVADKGKYVKDNALGGTIIWTIGQGHVDRPRRQQGPAAHGGEEGLPVAGAPHLGQARPMSETYSLPPRRQAPHRQDLHEAKIEVDECGACHGTWLDKGELEAIQATVERDYHEALGKPHDTVSEARRRRAGPSSARSAAPRWTRAPTAWARRL